jgi:formylglycine-generating enzyme required for sulfatase activity
MVSLCVLVLFASGNSQTSKQSSEPPFSKEKITKGLELGVTSKRMAALVSERGVDFALSPEIEKELRQAGADEELIDAVRKASASGKSVKEPAAGIIRANRYDELPYVRISPGTFQMGCSPGDGACQDDEKPPHSVTITKGFWIAQTPVTQAAYVRVMSINPSYFQSWNSKQKPVENVSWNEANAFCSAVGMRLPTEAEWEYAARAGSPLSRYGELDSVAWYQPNSDGQTREVGRKLPNAWKLYDMLGNVFQWTADWYDADYYRRSPEQDPKGPATGPEKVLRGGAWFFGAPYIRTSYRYKLAPGTRFNVTGFRCAGETLP